MLCVSNGKLKKMLFAGMLTLPLMLCAQDFEIADLGTRAGHMDSSTPMQMNNVQSVNSTGQLSTYQQPYVDRGWNTNRGYAVGGQATYQSGINNAYAPPAVETYSNYSVAPNPYTYSMGDSAYPYYNTPSTYDNYSSYYNIKPVRAYSQPSGTVYTQPSTTVYTQPSGAVYTQPSGTVYTQPSATVYSQPSAANNYNYPSAPYSGNYPARGYYNYPNTNYAYPTSGYPVNTGGYSTTYPVRGYNNYSNTNYTYPNAGYPVSTGR